MNELAALVGNYFADNLIEMQKLGLPYTHLRYSSQRAIPRNAETLFHDIIDISAKVCCLFCAEIGALHLTRPQVRRPLVLIGHSMGGAEALHVVLAHPELLIDRVVDRVVCIQVHSQLPHTRRRMATAAPMRVSTGLRACRWAGAAGRGSSSRLQLWIC